MSTPLLDVLKKATAYFESRGLEAPRVDAEILIAHGLGLKRIDLYLQHDRPLAEAELVPLRRLVAERGKGVPVAYLTGVKEFYALPFTVTPAVLVPRPETEHLVEAGLEAMKGGRRARLRRRRDRERVRRRGGAPRAAGRPRARDGRLVGRARGRARQRRAPRGRRSVRRARGALLDPLRADPAWGRLDAVLSNPPYVVRGDPTLERRVAMHEPAVALYVPGPDPLAFARDIARTALEALRPGGLVALEIGSTSGPAASEMLAGLGYADVAVVADLGGLPRVARGRRP